MTVITKRQVLTSGLLDKIDVEEPMIIFRGRDRFAPFICQTAAGVYYLAAVNAIKIRGMREIALAMEEYQKQHGSKIPD